MSAVARGDSFGDSFVTQTRDIRPLLWLASAAWMTFLGLTTAANATAIGHRALPLLPWLALLMLLQAFPLQGWLSTTFTVDQPVTVAMAIVLSPVEAGLVAFLGTIDLRELRGEVSLPQALFNRTVVGLPSFLGSLAAHQILRSPGRSAWIVPISLLVLACETAANLGPLALVLSIQQRYPVYQVIRNLRLGRLSDFLLMFLACSVLGAMLSTLYDQIHSWALFAFIVPTLLSRQALLRSQMDLDRDHAYRSREAALEALSRTIRDERSDERRLIAADLHDEVLQPLYKASLMAHVLKADLASGRLLQLDEDIPELVAAAELAAATLRGLIGDLHRSPLGTGGVTAALRTLVRNMQRQVLARIWCEVEDIAGSSDHELTLYQIGKEALTNAAAHSQASNIWLRLSRREDASVLTVRDDGIGFDPQSGREGHFGIHIMRERAASVGGELWIDSSPGRGTVVSAILPLDPPEITTDDSS